MSAIINFVKNNRMVRGLMKVAVSALFVVSILSVLYTNIQLSCYGTEHISVMNDFLAEQVVPLSGRSNAVQSFIAKGNILNNIQVYFADSDVCRINVTLSDSTGKQILQKSIFSQDYTKMAWNTLGMECSGLKKGDIYTLTFFSDTDLSCLCADTGEKPEAFGEPDLAGALAIGFSFTNRFLTKKAVPGLLAEMFAMLALAAMLCYGVCNVEQLVAAYHQKKSKTGLLYAVFYASTVTLLFNPLDKEKNEVVEFSRVIGSSIWGDVDISRRISNFNRWFLLFAVMLVLFYLIINYLRQQNKSRDVKEAEQFLDHYMVLANCSLVLRGIVYFQNTTNASAYSFADRFLLLTALAVQLYILLRMDSRISIGNLGKLGFIAGSSAFSVTILFIGRLITRPVLGVVAIVVMVLLLLVFFGRKRVCLREENASIDAGVMVSACLPLLTSIYAELLNVLNQYSVFVTQPYIIYAGLYAAVVLIWVTVAALLKRGKLRADNWKKWAFPVLIFGFSCLSRQIDLSSVYKLHVFEDANHGVLIGDFLNFGKIPNVEHYGGHMMTSVWEGILYGLINQDYAGAFVSPYAGVLHVVQVVLFYYLVKTVWNENLALLTTLLFPFYSFWYYYGIGMFICLAAMAYVKKPTYLRAAMLWAAFIWCTLYRLDIGFAFGFAVILAMMTYVITEKNATAAKQLVLTLAVWAFFGVVLWIVLCVCKGISPVERLLEFLYVNLSNQNWAYTTIGNANLTMFSWSYLFFPLVCVAALIYATISKTLRERIGKEKWMLLLVLGWAYIINFPRVLVRHSLVEMSLYTFFFTGLVFLAFFAACYKNNSKLFLPVLMSLMLCIALLLMDYNFSEPTVLESSASRVESVAKSWYQLAQVKEPVQRVVLSDEDEQYAEKFRFLDRILEDDETFVDFINKSTLYPVLNRENPVYVSQSPLQISGEFMQLKYIEQIENVPIVLMPVAEDYWSSTILDDVPNAYRYYAIAEYIYQNYVPLFRFGNDYAVWCLPERREAYHKKLSDVISSAELQIDAESMQTLIIHDAASAVQENELVLTATGVDPMIVELQNVIDLSGFVGMQIDLNIDYVTDVAGLMQVFYTTESGEEFNGIKVETIQIAGDGTASVSLPVTEHTRLRLDTPMGSTVRFQSITANSLISSIDYGYDGPVRNSNGVYSYTGVLHHYNLEHLPRVWGEFDRDNAVRNPVAASLEEESGIYTFDPSVVDKQKGNYLKITAEYDGSDLNGLYKSDDEQTSAVVIMGIYQDGIFEEKARFYLVIQEGTHDYLLRCSTDYYWYLNQINSVAIHANDHIRKLEMHILEGD